MTEARREYYESTTVVVVQGLQWRNTLVYGNMALIGQGAAMNAVCVHVCFMVHLFV